MLKYKYENEEKEDGGGIRWETPTSHKYIKDIQDMEELLQSNL